MFINQIGYGLMQKIEEVKLVPIIGVEPTTFASNNLLHKLLILRTECAAPERQN